MTESETEGARVGARRPESFRVADPAVVTRKRRVIRRRHAGAVEDRSVRPDVWMRAKKLAGGDVSRLVVESRTSVLIVNQSKGGRQSSTP